MITQKLQLSQRVREKLIRNGADRFCGTYALVTDNSSPMILLFDVACSLSGEDIHIGDHQPMLWTYKKKEIVAKPTRAGYNINSINKKLG
jgi:hypothetical protein